MTCVGGMKKRRDEEHALCGTDTFAKGLGELCGSVHGGQYAQIGSPSGRW